MGERKTASNSKRKTESSNSKRKTERRVKAIERTASGEKKRSGKGDRESDTQEQRDGEKDTNERFASVRSDSKF